jgi:hypothetical protein
MSMSCDHEKCEPYGSCQALTEYERRGDFWFRYRTGQRPGDMGTDPVAYVDGVTETR